MDVVEKLREFLKGRQTAFKLVFNPESLAVKTVMEDLAKFCRAEESCFHQDPRLHAVLEGRREVYLRIQKHLSLTQDEFLKTYGDTKNGS